MDDKKLGRMTDEEIIDYLVPIKGVGRWTVEMFLIFTLGREDVFAIDDLGIQNAMIRLFDFDRPDKNKFNADMLRISEPSAPYGFIGVCIYGLAQMECDECDQYGERIQEDLISSSRDKKKAMSMSFNNQKILQLQYGSFVRRTIPSLQLKVSL